MCLFGGNNNDQWIWILIIIFLIFCCGDSNVSGNSNCGCDNRCDNNCGSDC